MTRGCQRTLLETINMSTENQKEKPPCSVSYEKQTKRSVVRLGGVAQLGERVVRNDEAEGSNPFTSI